MHVPFVVKPPHGRGPGRRSAVPIQHVDLRPTLLDLAGAEVPRDLAGRSLRPILESPRGLIADRDVYGESLWGRYLFGWSELYSLTDDQFRFIKAPREELYDVRRDSTDRDNVIARRALTSAGMRDRLTRLLGDRRPVRPARVPAETWRRLEALGLPPAAAEVGPEVSASVLPDPKDEVAKRHRPTSRPSRPARHRPLTGPDA
jgi:arylsulfatase A-like enzyme